MDSPQVHASESYPLINRYGIFLEYYFIAVFFAVFCAGCYAWFSRIPHREFIPCIIFLYALLLIRKTICKEIPVYATIVLFPVTAIINQYGFWATLSCWYPVFANLFAVSLFRKPTIIFYCACVYHVASLVGLTIYWADSHSQYWYLGLATNLFAGTILVVAYSLFVAYGILVISKNRLIHENRLMANRNNELAENLRHVLRSALHDLGNWGSMSMVGLAQQRNDNETISDLLEEGIRGYSALANHLKSIIDSDTFSFLEEYTLLDLVDHLRKRLLHLGEISFSLDQAIQSTRVRLDSVILENALLNMLSNAASAKATRIKISFYPEPDDTIVIQIRDNGRGIQPSVSEKLFRVPIFPSSSGRTGKGLLGIKHQLAFMGCTVACTNPNPSGTEETVFEIHGLKIVKNPAEQELSPTL